MGRRIIGTAADARVADAPDGDDQDDDEQGRKERQPVPLHFGAVDEQQMQAYTETQQIESFRFIDWENFSPDVITLPIDKIVARILTENY